MNTKEIKDLIAVKSILSFVQMAKCLEQTSMSAFSAPQTSPSSNPFATYVKDILSEAQKTQ